MDKGLGYLLVNRETHNEIRAIRPKCFELNLRAFDKWYHAVDFLDSLSLRQVSLTYCLRILEKQFCRCRIHNRDPFEATGFPFMCVTYDDAPRLIRWRTSELCGISKEISKQLSVYAKEGESELL